MPVISFFLFPMNRANSRLTEANSKLLSERSRSLMMGNITSGSLMGPSPDMSALATPANPGTSVGALNRNMSVGYSLPSTVSDGQDQRVEDYLAKVCPVLHLSLTYRD